MMGIPMAWNRRDVGNSFALMGFRDGAMEQLALVKRASSGKWLWMVRVPNSSSKVTGSAPTMRHAMLSAESLIETHGGLLMRSHTMASDDRLTTELNLLGVLAAGNEHTAEFDKQKARRDLEELRELFERCSYRAGRQFQARLETLRAWTSEMAN
jgi:hypothetical protein